MTRKCHNHSLSHTAPNVGDKEHRMSHGSKNTKFISQLFIEMIVKLERTIKPHNKTKIFAAILIFF